MQRTGLWPAVGRLSWPSPRWTSEDRNGAAGTGQQLCVFWTSLAMQHSQAPIRLCRSGIGSLPREMLVKLLSLLTPRGLCAAGSTCKLLHAVAQEAVPALKLQLFPHQVGAAFLSLACLLACIESCRGCHGNMFEKTWSSGHLMRLWSAQAAQGYETAPPICLEHWAPHNDQLCLYQVVLRHSSARPEVQSKVAVHLDHGLQAARCPPSLARDAAVAGVHFNACADALYYAAAVLRALGVATCTAFLVRTPCR